MIIEKIATWSKIIRDTFVKLLIILTIISALYFWLFLFALEGEAAGVASIYTFVFTWSIVLVFISGISYYVFLALTKLRYKKEMSKVKINVKNN